MSEADVRITLRAIAMLIALLAALDPALPLVDAASRPVVIVKTATANVASSEKALREAAANRSVLTREVTNGRLPCANDEDCVLVADGSVDLDWDERLRPISLIKTPIAGAPNVRLQSVLASRGHRAAAGSARVRLEGRGVTGRRTELRVLDGMAVLGITVHQWSSDGSVVVDVPWWPLDAGARALRIEAVPIDGETTAVDNRIDIGVPIASETVPVLIFDARPSWHSTFIRRALEEDPRFAVRHRSRLAPSLSSGTSNGRLDLATLDGVPLVIAGSPEALTAADVSLLDDYVRVRGGTLVLLPERRPSGALAPLFSGNWTEHLTAEPESIGPLRAGELLRLANADPAATVLAASGTMPVIVSNPAGAGRIIISGATDAWRYRQLDAGAFDKFWRSLAAEGATAGEALSLTFSTDVLERGARASFILRDRHMAPQPSREASVIQRCGDALAQPVRVWPGGTVGEFAGEISAVGSSACTVEATVGERHVSASLAVVDHATRGFDDTLAKLERRVRASGGVVVNAGDESTVARTLVEATETASRDVTAHPMRPAWWMLPFAACLSIEWWLRRRHGLR